jgi:uncharacterized membrane protein YhaH (DUF805 family)
MGINYYLKLFKWLFFSFRGRINRNTFLLAIFILLFILYLLFDAMDYWNAGHLWVVAITYYLVLLAGGVSLCVKRLHDINLPGYWAIYLLIPAVDILGIVILSIYPGNNKDNQYGKG